jgi:hypothetical protein
MFVDLAGRHSDLVKQQKGIEIELAKLTQMIQSTFNMLTPVQQRKAGKAIGRIQGPKGGLKEGVRMALKAKSSEWLTPPEIRDYLVSVGFNFGGSSAGGLSSIATTLKRMMPEEVEARTQSSGQIGYRLRGYAGIDVGEVVMTFLQDLQNLPDPAKRAREALHGKK